MNKPFCFQDGNYDRFKINLDWLAEIWNCLLLRTGVVNNLNSFTSEGTQMERPILCLKKGPCSFVSLKGAWVYPL